MKKKFFCPICRMKISDKARYCPICGPTTEKPASYEKLAVKRKPAEK